MMFVKKALASVAVAGLVIAQPLAAAVPAVANVAPAERVGSASAEGEELAGGGVWLFLLLFAAGLTLAEVLELINIFDDEPDPTSP